MANIFEKAEKLAATALALLQKEIKGAGLFVHKFGISDYSGAKGDVVNIKRPPILRARDAGFRQRNALVVDNIVQSKIQVKLSKHPYSRVELSPEEATLDEVNYVRDVQAPQVRAISEDYDDSIVNALGGATFVHEVEFTPGAADRSGDARKVARRAKRFLDSSHVPAAGRFWLVGAAVSEEVASTDKLLEVDASGLPEALRDGVVGKLSGFIIIDWPALGDEESYFVHETAVAISAVAPKVPMGAKAGATVQAQGLAVTQVWDYQSDSMADQSTVHAFTGADIVTDPQVVDGEIVMDDATDEPVMEFVRAVKVNFGEPDTAESAAWTVATTGTVTGGTFILSIDGEATDPIAFDATNPVITSALNELAGVTGASVSGTATKTLKFQKRVIVSVDSAALEGGGNKTVTKA